MRGIVLTLILAGCATAARPPPPTAADARRFLDEVVRVARSGDLAALCDLGGGSCDDFLDQPGGANVPPTAPTVVGGRTLQPAPDEAGGRVGGYVLELCGTDADGTPYYSEMLVFRDFRGELRGIEPVYWLGIRITDGDQAGLHLDEAPASECRDDADEFTWRGPSYPT